LEAAFSEEFGLVKNDLGAVEQLVREKMQLLGQGLLQRIVDRQAVGGGAFGVIVGRLD